MLEYALLVSSISGAFQALTAGVSNLMYTSILIGPLAIPVPVLAVLLVLVLVVVVMRA
jgi:hypothetical protein